MITRKMARQKAVAFLEFAKKHLGLSHALIEQTLGDLIEDFNPNIGKTWEFEGKLGTVVVSETTGEIVSYFDSEDPNGVEITISIEDAGKAMRQFMSVAYNNFDKNRFVLVKTEKANGRVDFEFEQKLLPGEYSIFENFIAVSVRGDTPRVVAFDRSALDFSCTRPPGLDKNAAERLLRARMREGGKMTEIKLSEHPINYSTESITVWTATVEYNIGGFSSLELIAVNADTGANVQMDEDEP